MITATDNYTQLCVMEATNLGNQTPKDFEAFIAEELKAKAKFAEVVTTLPDRSINGNVPGTGGREDLFFFIHKDDIGNFAVPRFRYNIRWWEDCDRSLYSQEILEKYPNTWVGIDNQPSNSQ